MYLIRETCFTPSRICPEERSDFGMQDPANGQNYNRYTYVLNNPLKYTDSSGEAYNVNNPMEYYDGGSGSRYYDVDYVAGQNLGASAISSGNYRQIYLQRAREMGMIPSEVNSTFYFHKDGGQFLGGGNRNTNGDVLLSNGDRVNDGRYYFILLNMI